MFFALDRYFRKNNFYISLKVDTAVDYLRDGALVTFRSFENWDSISGLETPFTLPTNHKIYKKSYVKDFPI